MSMKLNVLGTVLLPLEDGRLADETLPICAVVNDAFSFWIKQSGNLHAVSHTGVGSKTLLSAETWIHAYQDNSSPPIVAEHSHERALYWLPLDLFMRSKDDNENVEHGDGYEQEATLR